MTRKPENKPAQEGGHKSTTYLRQKDEQELQRLTVYLPKDLAKRLRVYCVEEETKLGRTIEEAVRAFLETKAKK